jgi:hypothetical protein
MDSVSPRRKALAFARQLALREIDGLPAFGAFVGPIEFVGENLLLGAAFRAIAVKGFQTFEVGVAGAMLGCGFIWSHGILPF